MTIYLSQQQQKKRASPLFALTVSPIAHCLTHILIVFLFRLESFDTTVNATDFFVVQRPPLSSPGLLCNQYTIGPYIKSIVFTGSEKL